MSHIQKKVFRFDAEMLDAVIKAYESEPLYSHGFGGIQNPFDARLFNLPFNKEYTAYLTLEEYEKFKNFAVNILAHQSSVSVHPLTCGVDSNHELLVPRITLTDNLHVIVCPTCGYVQPMSRS